MNRYLTKRMPHEYRQPAKRHMFRGEWLTVTEIAEKYGISRNTLRGRLRYGNPIDEVRKGGPTPRRYEFQDQLLTAKEIAAVLRVDISTVYARVCGNRVLELHEIGSAFQTLEDWGDRITILPFCGRRNSITGWAREIGLSHITIRSRLRLGWTVEQALTRPVDISRRPKVSTRNYRLISVMTRRFRTARNHQLIHRITQAFHHPHHPQTGGYHPTFTHSQGTGVGSQKTDFDPQTEKAA